jgi:hypothetical protein
MSIEEPILNIIKESLDDVNAEREADLRVPFSPEVILFGIGSPLDSLDFVNFVASVEERVQNSFGKSVNLTEAILDGKEGLPYRSVGELAAYLATMVTEL